MGAALVFWGLSQKDVFPEESVAPQFTVRATGFSEGTGLAARKLAVEHAQQQIMEDVLQSMAGTFDLSVLRPVLRNASKYIRQYDILRTATLSNGTEVEIDAHILERPLRHDVAALMLPRLPRKPNVLLLIADYIGPGAETASPTFDIAETAIRERIKEVDFSIRGVHALLDYHDPLRLLTIIQGGVQEGAEFARAMQEDVVIIGTARASYEPLAAESNLFRCRAVVSLRVFTGTDGKMTDTMVAEAAVQSADPYTGAIQAITDACARITSDCIVAVVFAMLAAGDETRVTIDIKATHAAETAGPVADILRQVPGVAAVEPLFVSDALARLGLEYSGPMSVLSDALSGKRLGSRAIEVVRCVKREMTVTLR